MAEVIGTGPQTPALGSHRMRCGPWGWGLGARAGDAVIALDSFLAHTPVPTPGLTHARSPLGLLTHTLARCCPVTHAGTLTHTSTCTLAPSPSCHSHTHTHTHTIHCFKCTLSLLIINILASYSNHSKIKYGYVGEQGESACRSVTRSGPRPRPRPGADLVGVPRPSMPPSPRSPHRPSPHRPASWVQEKTD